jgi:hypothetical protein
VWKGRERSERGGWGVGRRRERRRKKREMRRGVMEGTSKLTQNKLYIRWRENKKQFLKLDDLFN